MYIVKLTASGSLDTSFGSNGTLLLGGTSSDYAYSISQTSDGGYIVAGQSNDSSGAGSYDMYIVKLTASGELSGTCSSPSINDGPTTTGGVNTTNNGPTTINSVATVNNGPTTTNSVGTLNQQCSASSTNANQMVFNINNFGQVGIGASADLGYRLNVNGLATSNGWLTSSDKRFKKKIKTIDNSLDKLTRLEGVSYYYDTDKFANRGFDNHKHLGLVAQDVQKVFPELVYTDATGYKAVDYIGLISPIINSIKEQQSQIEAQNIKIQSNTLKTDQNINTLKELQASVDNNLLIINQTLVTINKEQTAIKKQIAENQENIEANTESLATLSENINSLTELTTTLTDTVTNHEKRIAKIEELLNINNSNDSNNDDDNNNNPQIPSFTNLPTVLESLADNLAILSENDSEEEDDNNPPKTIFSLSGDLILEKLKAQKVEAEEVEAKQVTTKVLAVVSQEKEDSENNDASTAGKGIIQSGEKSVFINTSAVEKKDKIFITPRVATNKNIAVTEIREGEGFLVEVPTNLSENEEAIKFDWLIVK